MWSNNSGFEENIFNITDEHCYRYHVDKDAYKERYIYSVFKIFTNLLTFCELLLIFSCCCVYHALEF